MSFLFAPFNVLTTYFSTFITRRYNNAFSLWSQSHRHEFQADGFAVSLGHGPELTNALVKMEKDNLGFPLCDPVYAALHRSHPTLLERIRHISDLQKKAK